MRAGKEEREQSWRELKEMLRTGSIELTYDMMKEGSSEGTSEGSTLPSYAVDADVTVRGEDTMRTLAKDKIC